MSISHHSFKMANLRNYLELMRPNLPVGPRFSLKSQHGANICNMELSFLIIVKTRFLY